MSGEGPFADRRARFLASLGERAAAVFPSAPVCTRNADIEHPYRQDSDLYYLTGLEEPESVLVLSRVHEAHRAVLFLRPRDPEKEGWDGARLGVEGAIEQLGLDAGFDIAELGRRLPDYLQNADEVIYPLGRNPAFDRSLMRAIHAVRRRHRRGVDAPSAIVDPSHNLHEQRLRKSADELACLRRAAAVTRAGHAAAFEHAEPGAFEYEVEAEILRAFRRGGSPRPAYHPIVGSGKNGTVLHHRQNQRQMLEGELLLVDAGAEVDYYASDVTRTFPVSGRFTAEQRAVYEAVLAAQEDAVALIRPGVTVEDIHERATRRLTEGLIELGLLGDALDEALEKKTYERFTRHRTSHWLGMDVHDVGAYFHRGRARPLEPGFVLTVEPGIYIPDDGDIAAGFAGMGVRIEDDVLVTKSGYENLSAAIPKQPGDMER